MKTDNSEVRHIRLYHTMMDKPAFIGLSSHAKSLLLLLLRLHNGYNNGAIECSVRHAAGWLHAGKATAHKAFRELLAAQFIAPECKGHFAIKSGPHRNVGTTWRLLFVTEKRP